MLTIFVRHTKACLGDTAQGIPGLHSKQLSSEKLRAYRHCNCPKWYSGTHDGQWHARTTLNANTWEAAERALDKIKAGVTETAGITMVHAIEEWLKEVRLNHVAEGTRLQWEYLGKRILKFCQEHRIKFLKGFDAAAVNCWRSEWQVEVTRNGVGIKPNTANVRIAVLKLFFAFTRRMRWLPENPMDLIKVSNRIEDDEEEHATQPLDTEGDQNYRALLEAIPAFLDGTLAQEKGQKFSERHGLMATRPYHLVAITELMYETGLRGGDAIQFEVDKMEVDPADGWASYTTKQQKLRNRSRKGCAVTVAIPPGLVKDLQKLPRISPRYVFWDGTTKIHTYHSGQIWRHLHDVGNAIGLTGVRSHRLRDSFAVNRLNEGMLIQDVSKLLGHASVQMTEKYYLPFVKSRQDALVAKRKQFHNTNTAPAKVVPIKRRAS